jgi:hypothetical protein
MILARSDSAFGSAFTVVPCVVPVAVGTTAAELTDAPTAGQTSPTQTSVVSGTLPPSTVESVKVTALVAVSVGIVVAVSVGIAVAVLAGTGVAESPLFVVRLRINLQPEKREIRPGIVDSTPKRLLEHGSQVSPCLRMTLGVPAQRRRRLIRGQLHRDSRNSRMAANPEADRRRRLHVFYPVRMLPESRGNHIGVWRRMIDNLEDDVALASGYATAMLQHEEALTEQNAEPEAIHPDWRPDQPARAQDDPAQARSQ